MQDDRILAYQMSEKLNEELLQEISGGHLTRGMTGNQNNDVFNDGDFA